MRLILTILLLWVMQSDAQIIMASPFYKTPNVASSFYGILDTVTGATVAVSTRKLLSTYSGSCYRVRRSSDNTEQDIGFLSNGDLDTASLKTFVGANSGFVTKWYDQSGNGNDISQTTSGNQPRVVLSGTLDRQNGLPVVRFLSASSTRITTTGTLFNGGTFTFVSAVGTFNAANQDFGGIRNGTTGWHYYYRTTGTGYGFANLGGNSSTYSFGSIQANGVVIYGGRTSGQSNTLYANNNLGTNAGANNYTTSTSAFYLGYGGVTGAAYFNGPLMEFIGYASDKSADRTTLQNSTNGYYKCY